MHHSWLLPGSVDSGARERAQPRDPVATFGDIIGVAPCMLEMFADLRRIAPSNASLLIEGETGTGKELAAGAVHQSSLCAHGPYIVFDCGSAAPGFAESDLFGHERGAVPGADTARAGAFEEAHGGTLVLDAIGELPRQLQPRLLRVLERREVRRLGSARPHEVSFRLIAVTNRNLEQEVRLGNFREDLYFRMAEAQLEVPPLRERLSDLPALLDHMLGELSPGKTHRDIPPDLLEALRAYRWPGNVRELRNVVRRFALTPERPFSPARADSALVSPPLLPLRQARRESAARFERHYLAEVLQRSGGNVTRAAAMAGVSRQMVQKLLRRNSID